MRNTNEKKHFGHIEIPLKRVHIELTNICNFDCVFCPKSEMKRPPGYMDVNLAKRIIDELKSNNICEKITFHIMGEPTMHPKFFDILDYAQLKQVNIGLTTNGTRLDNGIGKRLIDYDLHQLDISLQTPDEKSFLLRKAGKLSFDDYANGIINFFSAYNVREKRTIFKFRFLNTRFCTKEMSKRLNSVNVNSSSGALRDTLSLWAGRIYDVLGIYGGERERALKRIRDIVSYKWNVIEVYNNVFFETYLLRKWEDAFERSGIRDAWCGYCFGMRDHFGILYNGDVVLCCIDFNGHTAIGNLHNSSLQEVLSSSELGEIMDGFRKYRLVHPYCRKCLGSKTATGRIFKPLGYLLSLKLLKPFFYKHSNIWK